MHLKFSLCIYLNCPVYWPANWNSSTIACVCYIWWLKWAPGVWGYTWATQPLGGYKYEGLVLQVTGWAWDWHPHNMGSILLWIQMKIEARTLKKLNNQKRFIWITGPKKLTGNNHYLFACTNNEIYSVTDSSVTLVYTFWFPHILLSFKLNQNPMRRKISALFMNASEYLQP